MGLCQILTTQIIIIIIIIITNYSSGSVLRIISNNIATPDEVGTSTTPFTEKDIGADKGKVTCTKSRSYALSYCVDQGGHFGP